MAKRHHSSHVRKHGRIGAEHYADYDSRRMQEHEDFEMMPSGQGDFANLPQEVVMKLWPKVQGAIYHLDDTIKGVDHQMHDDMKEKKDGMYPEKY